MLAEAKLKMVCTVGDTEIVMWELSSHAKPDELYSTALAVSTSAMYAATTIDLFFVAAAVVPCLTAIADWGKPCAR